mmetsp:Transcript_32442/g.58048  ORF Transcript_32442/g.58048 Transcript_32442/m.58048 type:complete len:318 (-) Transcript_32442:178-1131(-)
MIEPSDVCEWRISCNARTPASREVGCVDRRGQPLRWHLSLQHEITQLGRHLHLAQKHLQLVALHPFQLLQLRAQPAHCQAVCADHLHRHLQRALHQRAHLHLHQPRQLSAVVSKQHLITAGPERGDIERPHRGAQPPLRYRHLRQAGCALDVVTRARGYLSAKVLLRGAAAHEDGQLCAQLRVKHQRAVLLCGGVSEPEGTAAARYNTHALYHWEVGEQLRYRSAQNGVPNLMLRHDFLILALKDGAFLLHTRDGAQHRAVKVDQAHFGLVVAPSQQGRLVDQVGEVGAGEAGGGGRDLVQRDVVLQRQPAPLQVHL